MDVFLSRPTTVSPAQQSFVDELGDVLSTSALTSRTVGVSDFSNDVPLKSVQRLMAQCHGAVVLGLKQHLVSAGVWKAVATSPRAMRDLWLPTPWNHIEGAMAYALKLPILLVLEPDVQADGIFGVGSSDVFVHTAQLTSGWLNSAAFRQPYQEWLTEVRAHAASGSAVGWAL